ncbi:MAG TPA: folylpolyglutamate synthase/dihydrofolate synthase family protein [Gemmatimonadales bacterium]|nr:folylpolyglutamate synthase/dihydrofolate synthase family protein [Gemmatimonadales bacterium]
MPLTYADALAYLYPRVTQIKFGLETTRTLLAELGDPHRVMPIVHVGGTNGKGSVTALVAGGLGAAGWRVGSYTSPHLVSFRERVTVDGNPIGEAAAAMWIERLQPLADRLGATFFETTTAVAFADLAARGAEVAVIEVGLGGRLDSTNVVQPLVSVVTKIEKDHQKYLGDSLEAIAREKAWIAKPNAPFVVGETRAEIVAVLREEAGRAVHTVAPGSQADVRVVAAQRQYEGPLGLVGAHQRRNAAVARAVLEALPAPYRPDERAIQEGFAAVSVPGRFDQRGKWLFDVAHNPDGIAALCRTIEEVRPARPLHALVSILGEKAWSEMLVRLDQVVDRGILTITPSAEGRRWDIDWLRRWLRDPNRPKPHAAWQLIPDFAEALRRVQQDAKTVLVTGSFHTVGDVMEVLGLGVV